MTKETPKIDTTLQLFYVDTTKNLKAIRCNGYRFVPNGWTFPTENHHACCEKLIPKPAPNGTKKLPRHVGCHSIIACRVS